MPIATNCRQKFSQANHFSKGFPENSGLLQAEVQSFQAFENGPQLAFFDSRRG